QEMLGSLVDRKKMKDDEEKEEMLCAENQGEDQLKKPRRKDTPVLNSPPHLPAISCCIHLENRKPLYPSKFHRTACLVQS
ncbi:hypothetical protein L3Q82_017849, partial [Scortum barcoo]